MKVYRYRQLVKFSKIFCIIMVIGLTLFLIVAPKVNPSKDKVSIVNNENLSEQEDIRIINPNLLGFSEENGPYQISAEKIIQKSNNIFLQKIKAKVSWQHNDNFFIEANDAEINLVKKLLKIFNNVKIEVKNLNYKFLTEELYIDNSKNFYSDKIVNFIYPSGKTISNNGIFIDNKLNEINLLGKVDAIFNMTNKDKLLAKGENLKLEPQIKQITIDKDVYLKTKNIELTARKFKAYYDKKFILKEIDLKDMVVIKTPKGQAYSDQAKYLIDKKELILSENVELHNNNKIVKAKILKYDLKNDSFIIEGSNENKQDSSDSRIDLVIK